MRPKTKLLVWLPRWKIDPIHSGSESVLEDASCECIFCIFQALLEKTGKAHSWFIKHFHKFADARPESEVQERPRATYVTVVAEKLMCPPWCGNWGTRLSRPGWAQGSGSCLPVLAAPSHPACPILSWPTSPSALAAIPQLPGPLLAVSAFTCTAESLGAHLGI